MVFLLGRHVQRCGFSAGALAGAKNHADVHHAHRVASAARKWPSYSRWAASPCTGRLRATPHSDQKSPCEKSIQIPLGLFENQPKALIAVGAIVAERPTKLRNFPALHILQDRDVAALTVALFFYQPLSRRPERTPDQRRRFPSRLVAFHIRSSPFSRAAPEVAVHRLVHPERFGTPRSSSLCGLYRAARLSHGSPSSRRR